jgi:MoaA/NifB/PqqE/SkfB family radical SAM enzyme
MNSNYCSAVDTGLFVSVQGAVGLCCSGSESLGNIRDEPIKDIFAKQRFIEIQSALKNNQSHSYCSGCDRIEQVAPGSSQRSAFNDQFRDNEKRQIKLADIRWSNVCNLSCRYCNTHDSSEWRRLHSLPIESVNRDYTESLFEELEENKQSLEGVYLLGGEPLMQKHNLRLLDIIDKNTKIDILTNLSVPLDNNKIYEKLKSFPNVYWNLSFDNVGDRFEYVRQGGLWSVFSDNVRRLCDDFGSNHVTFHPVYTIWNSINLEEYYEYAATGNFRVNWQLALPKLDDPYLGTDSFITFGHKKSIIDRAVKEIEKLNIIDPTVDGIRASLISDIAQPDKDKNFLIWTERMEKFMPPNKSFAQLWPELNTLLCN